MVPGRAGTMASLGGSFWTFDPSSCSFEILSTVTYALSYTNCRSTILFLICETLDKMVPMSKPIQGGLDATCARERKGARFKDRWCVTDL